MYVYIDVYIDESVEYSAYAECEKGFEDVVWFWVCVGAKDEDLHARIC